ncbi:hypothetical protein [Janthinobacterium rivuli]|uniref:hypothetical protein n=1 Tax=Janthinobacterium rivuli TaxID=2751478 RepID=UPI00383A6349
MNMQSLSQRIDDHFSLHFLKRLAYMDESGCPPQWILTDQRHLYVQEASHRLVLLRAAIADARGLITQATNPPPEEWIASVGLTQDKYIQQKVDLFTLVLHSTADRAFLLTNAVLNLGVEPRKLSLKEISKKLQNESEIIAALNSVHSSTLHLADSRNRFAHRGERRYVGQFSNVTRLKAIVRMLEFQSEKIQFADSEASQRLEADLQSELSSVENVLEQLLENLLPGYLAQIQLLGGPDTPNADEIARAEAALVYFKGGDRPAFMDG